MPDGAGDGCRLDATEQVAGVEGAAERTGSWSELDGEEYSSPSPSEGRP